MFHTDVSKEATGTMLSSVKPLGACIFGLSSTISTIKHNINFPVFDSFEEMMIALKKQCDYHTKKRSASPDRTLPEKTDLEAAKKWIESRSGDAGEETLDLVSLFGVTAAQSGTAATAKEAAALARKIGYPVVLKVVSPDALHKSEAGGVILDVRDDDGVTAGFEAIRKGLAAHRRDARFEGVRVMRMAGDGHDMFIGGKQDDSFGPVVFFGYGGIYIEVFRDVRLLLCPAGREEIAEKLEELRSIALLRGARGRGRADIESYVDMICRVSHLLAAFPRIRELDLNPVRLPFDGSGACALDARARIA